MDYTQPNFSSHRKYGFIYCISIVNFVLSVLGVTFNILIVHVLVKHCIFKNVTNIFVLTLAISDILLCSINIPIQTHYDITESTGFGTWACKIVFSMFGVPMYISCLTILLIAVDRYRIIIYPLKARISRMYATICVVIVVMFSVLSSAPVALFTHSVFTENVSVIAYKEVSYCVEYWPTTLARLIYSLLSFIFYFLLPLTVTAYLYICIYVRLRTRTFKKRDNARKHRTNKILMAIVLCFVIFWSPWTIYSLYLETHTYLEDLRWLKGFLHRNSPDFNNTIMDLKMKSHVKLMDQTLKCFATVSCVINPFLYGWLNDSIKEVLCKMFERFRQTSIKSLKLQRHSNHDLDHHKGNKCDGKPGEWNGPDFNIHGGIDHKLSANQNKKDGMYLTTNITPSTFEASTKRTSLYPSTIQRIISNCSQDGEASFILHCHQDLPIHPDPISFKNETKDGLDSSVKIQEQIDVFTAMALAVKEQTCSGSKVISKGFDRNRRRSVAGEFKKRVTLSRNRKASLM